LNELLYLNYTKVEQCASGAVHCQIMDALYPGHVPLSRVNFNATQTYEFVENYKVLQKVFKSVGIERNVDVPSLIKAKYQDNLEFLQWIKCYYDNLKKDDKYDAEARRKECGINVNVKCGGRGSGTSPPPTQTKPNSRDRSISTPSLVNPNLNKTTTSNKINSTPSVHKSSTSSTSSSTTSNKTIVPNSRPSVSTSSSRPSVVSSRPSVSTSNSSSRPSVSTYNKSMNTRNTISLNTQQKGTSDLEEKLKSKEEKISNLSNQIKELNLIVEALGKERDFYFNRLRNVEIYCQTHTDQNDQVIKDIEQILYSSEENQTVKSEINEDETF